MRLKLVSQLFPVRDGMNLSLYRSLLGELIGEDRKFFRKSDGEWGDALTGDVFCSPLPMGEFGIHVGEFWWNWAGDRPLVCFSKRFSKSWSIFQQEFSVEGVVLTLPQNGDTKQTHNFSSTNRTDEKGNVNTRQQQHATRNVRKEKDKKSR